ncbi:MAG: hypothetical protein EXR05_10815 [Acetobacteraceae bacterium]|nr:hypothetical protein [Acetobacteraceae bacterium]
MKADEPRTAAHTRVRPERSSRSLARRIRLNIAVLAGFALALSLLIPVGNLIGHDVDASWSRRDARARLVNYQI